MAGRMINGAAALAELIRPASDTDEIGVHRVLPVLPELGGLLPGRGLRRGSTVAVATGQAAPAGGGTSLLLALLSAASQSGSWCAVVGVPALGALAAAESGIALDRLALVPNPGPDWPTVVAALIDGVDLVVTAVPGPISSSIAGRLAARARQRGSVLVPFGSWAGADLTLQVTQGRWEGLARGHGRLRRRRVTVLARGRGAAARPRELTMWMPGVTIPLPVPPRGVPGPPAHGSVTAAPATTGPVAAAPALTAVPSPSARALGVAPTLTGGPVTAVPAGPVAAGPVAVAPATAGLVAAVPAVAVVPSPSASALGVAPTLTAGPVIAGPVAAGPVIAVPSPSALVLFAVGHSLGRHVPRSACRGGSCSSYWILWHFGRWDATNLQDRAGSSLSRRVAPLAATAGAPSASASSAGVVLRFDLRAGRPSSSVRARRSGRPSGRPLPAAAARPAAAQAATAQAAAALPAAAARPAAPARPAGHAWHGQGRCELVAG